LRVTEGSEAISPTAACKEDGDECSVNSSGQNI